MAEFVEGFESLGGITKAVSIFGSARTCPGEPYYQAAEETARLLAHHGFAIITGGGPGIMEAANKGAFEAGGVSVGCNITLPQEQEANKYQTISLDFHYFYARKVMFTKYASAFICYPGGYGTLDEFFETMTLIQTLKVESFPVLLYGSEYWSGLIDWMRRDLQGKFIDDEDLDIFRQVDSPQQAVDCILEGVSRPWWHPADSALAKAIEKADQRGKAPLAGAWAGGTGEGTRYGKRAKRPERDHVQPSAKPSE
jgi:uncharacterized protein (TIGR00730 family)